MMVILCSSFANFIYIGSKNRVYSLGVPVLFEGWGQFHPLFSFQKCNPAWQPLTILTHFLKPSPCDSFARPLSFFLFFFSFPHYNPPEPKLLVGHISCTAYTCTSFLCPCIVFLWKLQFLCLYNEHSHILQNNIIHGILGDVFILN